MKKRNTIIKRVVIIGIIFCILAFIIPDFEIFGLKYRTVKFAELFDSTATKKNVKADSLIDKYLSANEKNYIKDSNFINPMQSGRRALDYFYTALIKESDSNVVHIAHYGDSQLEGDRISCVLREYFQKDYGGNGIGFVPITDICNHVSIQRKESSNWDRDNIFHNHHSDLYYGLSGMLFTFDPNAKIDALKGIHYKKGSVHSDNFITNAYLNIHSLKEFSKVYLMYGKSENPIYVRTSDESKNVIALDTMQATGSFMMKSLSVKTFNEEMTIEFSANFKPDIYGLMFDGKSGVQVDNYAIRGHGGKGLLNLNDDYLKLQLKKLNTKLIIIQYGANTVPYIKSQKECDLLEETYYCIFNKFKRACPDISLLVIGVGDMVKLTNGKYSSYKIIPQIIKAQRNAAIKAHCAFWNLYEFMGGENSLLNWCDNKLANKNGHFTAKGQDIVGKELYNKIIGEYKNNYQKKSSPKKVS